MGMVEACVTRGRSRLRRWLGKPRAQGAVRCAAYLGAGFLLAAAGLMHSPMPLAMGFVWACDRWAAALAALGGAAGYWIFWGLDGVQGMLWCGLSFLGAVALGGRKLSREAPLLAPATAALIAAVTGVAFQNFSGDDTAVPVYILRVLAAGGCAWVFTRVMEGRNPILDWLAAGLGVLALAQILPFPWLGLGYVGAGALITAGAFPAAALGGLALDLSQVCAVPMTAVAVFSYLVRFFPSVPESVRRLSPGFVYLLTAGMLGIPDFLPLPGLVLGGILGAWLPGPATKVHRRGEVGVAQVRLELAAGVLRETGLLLLEVQEEPVDQNAIYSRAAERACAGCPCRKSCKDQRRIAQLPGLTLEKPLLSAQELPIPCRKSGRMLAELHRAQEQLRSVMAQRERQREYRQAVIQQYRFGAEFLRELSDGLNRRPGTEEILYVPRVRFYGNRPQGQNGDRCLRFAGTGGKYYVLLCDGMGTGLGAVQEGKRAGDLLRQLLRAGYTAPQAMESFNSLCALRDRAGASTADLAELDLSTGKLSLYKWGAMPSYLLSTSGVEKLGKACPPPGLSVEDREQRLEKLPLGTGRLLVMVSDGVEEEEALRCCKQGTVTDPEALAAALLSCSSCPGEEDDATVITVSLESPGE